MDQYGKALAPQAAPKPQGLPGYEQPGWHVFEPHENGFERVREIHVVDKPLVIRAYDLPKGAKICIVYFRDSGDCTQSTANHLTICGKKVCLTCDHSVEILTIPGRYAPVVDGERNKHVYLEEQKVSTEMGALATQQLRCCCA